MQGPDQAKSRRHPIAKEWYIWIFASYAGIAVILTTITYLVNFYSVPASTYELNRGLPQTIVLATFVNGTWDHLSANLSTMGLLLVTALVIPLMDPTMMGSRRYLMLLSWGQVAAGLIGAFAYYAILVVHGIGPDGAGSSIINAGLIGIIIVALCGSILKLMQGKQYGPVAILASFLTASFGELVQSFLQSGNGAAHFWGFTAGFFMAVWFLQT